MKQETKEKLIFLAVCLAVVFVMYGQTILGDFVFDDRGIVENQALFSDLNQLHRTLTMPYWSLEAGAYRPITLASYTFNYALLGASPWGFHLFNLIFYALSGFLIFIWLKKLFGNKLFAYLAALFFLVLPIHSETVANIIGRAEILALFFSLLLFWELLKDPSTDFFDLSHSDPANAGEKSRPNGRPAFAGDPSSRVVGLRMTERRKWGNLSKCWRPGLWFLLAMGSKETAIAALPIAVVVVWIKEKKNRLLSELVEDPITDSGIKNFTLRQAQGIKFLVKKYLPVVVLIAAGAVIYFGARFLVLGRHYFLLSETSLVENPLQFASTGGRVLTAFKILGIYIQKTFWPFNLCSDYSYNQIPILRSLWDWQAMVGLAVFLFLVASLVIFWRRAKILAFGSFFFLASFWLVSNLPMAIGTIAGERLMYYPSLGLVIWMAWGIIKIKNLLIDCRKTILYNPHPISVIPAPRPANGEAPQMRGRGKAGIQDETNPNGDLELNNLDPCFRRDDNYKLYSNWARVIKILFILFFICLMIFYGVMSFLRGGDWLTEKRLFISAAKCAPQSVLSLSNFGATYYLEGDLVNAKKWLLAAQAIYPDYPKGVNNLGLIYWKEGDNQKARELFLKALSYKFPFYGAYENLALLALGEGKNDEARQWLLKFYSGNVDATDSYINIYLAVKAASK